MREIIYNIDNATAGRTVEVTGLTETLTANNVLGIINKTTKKVLYAPTVGALQSVSYANGTLTIVLADTVTAITAGDKLLVKLYSDYSDPSQAAEDLATFFGLPSALPQYTLMTEQEVTGTLEDIMRIIDPNLTAAQAAAITAQTLNPSES